MASSTVRPLEYKPGDVKMFTNQSAFRAFLQQRKDVMQASTPQNVEPSPTPPPPELPGNIKKCNKKSKHFMNRFQPLPNVVTKYDFDVPHLNRETYSRLGSLLPIPKQPPVNVFESCSNKNQAQTPGRSTFETCSNKTQRPAPTPTNAAADFPNDLEYVQLQPLEDMITIEHSPVYSTFKQVERISPCVKSSTVGPKTAQLIVLEDPQSQPFDYSQQYQLPADFNCQIDEEEINVATDFFTTQQDEIALTIDDVMNSILTEMFELMKEIRRLLFEPRNLETISKINNLMAKQRKSAGAFQRILSTYPVRQSGHMADPMMNS